MNTFIYLQMGYGDLSMYRIRFANCCPTMKQMLDKGKCLLDVTLTRVNVTSLYPYDYTFTLTLYPST